MTAAEAPAAEAPRDPETADVVVIGAGPTGLLLAGDLAAAGLHVILLERRARTAANLTRAFAVHARTLELLDARGLADELVSTGRRIDRVRPFGGIALSLQRLRSRYPFVLITPNMRQRNSWSAARCPQGPSSDMTARSSRSAKTSNPAPSPSTSAPPTASTASTPATPSEPTASAPPSAEPSASPSPARPSSAP